MLTMSASDIPFERFETNNRTHSLASLHQTTMDLPVLVRKSTQETLWTPTKAEKRTAVASADVERGSDTEPSSRTKGKRPLKPERSRPLRILVSPAGFKESLGPEHVADAIEDGIRRVLDKQSATVQKLPLHDGGEGFAHAMVSTHGGEEMQVEVTGPIGQPVNASLGFIGPDRHTAILDMASCAGLRLVPKDLRDPTRTTTFGVGQLIKRALDEGSSKIIIGCGDSGTSDGGAGMLQALGARLLDVDGNSLPIADGGRSLNRLSRICWTNLHSRLRPDAEGSKVELEAVCNVHNVLCGPKGVAKVYGPQKGASPAQVELLARAMGQLAKVAESKLTRDISQEPGSGASGGLGAGLLLLGAKLRARSEAINEYFKIDEVISQQWDFVITAEGSLDKTSTGKMTAEVARRARQNGAQVVALAGTIGVDASATAFQAGIKAFTSILRGPITLDEAISQSEELISDGAEKIVRMILVGVALGRGFQ